MVIIVFIFTKKLVVVEVKIDLYFNRFHIVKELNVIYEVINSLI